MLKQSLVLSFLFLMLPIFLSAQLIEIKEEVTHSQTYNHNTGFWNNNTFSRIKFRVVGESDFKGIGVLGHRLKKHIQHDDEAMKSFNRFKRKKIIGVTSATAMVGSFVMLAKHNLDVSEPGAVGSNNQGSRLENKEFLYMSIGFGITSMITFFLSKKDVFKSIDIYNSNNASIKEDRTGALKMKFDMMGYHNEYDKSSSIGLGVKLIF